MQVTHDDLARLDATGQAELVRSGEVSARELVEGAIARIEALNPRLNAVIVTDFERALKAAAIRPADDAPFGGVPFLLKDIGANQIGLPYWAGSRALKDAGYLGGGDTVLGARFRAAGLITLGKTNLPEFGSCPTTQPFSCGPTANPWDPDRSPAGSSGGSGAAVASGMVAMAHANDGGGSTRLPAAWCGLVGLKTTRGRVPNPDTVSRLVSELVVSRSVRDTARLLDAVHGATPGDLFQAPAPDLPYARVVDADSGPLRIALMTDGGAVSIDRECVAGVEAAARALEGLGHSVEPVSSEVLLGPASAVNGRLWMAGIARRVQAVGELLGRPLTADEVEPYNWSAAERGRLMTAVDWVAAEEAQQRWSSTVVEWLRGWDLLVSPTAGCPPLTTAELEPPRVDPWKIGRTYGRIGIFTLPFNVTGNPAISLPLHETASGLPVGVQLVAAMGREDLLLQVAAQLEQALPWVDRRPALFAATP
jgi:amidase